MSKKCCDPCRPLRPSTPGSDPATANSAHSHARRLEAAPGRARRSRIRSQPSSQPSAGANQQAEETQTPEEILRALEDLPPPQPTTRAGNSAAGGGLVIVVAVRSNRKGTRLSGDFPTDPANNSRPHRSGSLFTFWFVFHVRCQRRTAMPAPMTTGGSAGRDQSSPLAAYPRLHRSSPSIWTLDMPPFKTARPGKPGTPPPALFNDFR